MSGRLRLGVIADDYTGGADVAGMIAQHGVRTVQLLGVPTENGIAALAGRYEAAVVCLKSRAAAPARARAMAGEALERLRLLDPKQFQFKYCSTFDSTPRGNIGPVTDTLMEKLDVDFTVAVPALPVNGRTQYLGYLFVGGQLLSESPMRRHPVNPMTDANLVRHLQLQTSRKVGLVGWPAVRAGARAIQREFRRLKAEGVQIALLDAIEERDVETIAEAVLHFRLITGGSGIAEKLAAAWKRQGLAAGGRATPSKRLKGAAGVLVLAGSCSAATLEQIDVLRRSGCPSEELDVRRLLEDSHGELERLTRAALAGLKSGGAALIYSSAPPEKRAQIVQWAEERGLPADRLAGEIERAFQRLAVGIIGSARIRRLVVAGGETAGAVLEALNLPALEVVEILDPGVPALLALGEREMGLALKSGNFGGPRFFVKAIRYLEEL